MVVFGSQSAMDTEKQATQTLKSNMKDGEAMFLYVDTDKLDPNSDLGKVARRNAGGGHGLGETGKSDLAFTGIYTVEQKADGSLGLGKSTATFWGGRDEISGIMREQMKYAKNATLKLPDDGTGPKPEDKPAPGPSDRPAPGPSIRPDSQPSDRPAPSAPPVDQVPQGDKQVPPQEQKPDQQPPAEQDPSKDREKERQRKDEEDAQRKEKQKQRLEELEKVGGKKGYTLDQYATGWGRFLERQEVEPAAMKNMLDEFGKQMINGEPDERKLALLMHRVGVTDQASVDKVLEGANDELKQSGLKLNVEVGANGLISKVELAEIGKSGQNAASISVNNRGEIKSGEYSGAAGAKPEYKEKPYDFISMKLAKKAEPAACP